MISLSFLGYSIPSDISSFSSNFDQITNKNGFVPIPLSALKTRPTRPPPSTPSQVDHHRSVDVSPPSSPSSPPKNENQNYQMSSNDQLSNVNVPRMGYSSSNHYDLSSSANNLASIYASPSKDFLYNEKQEPQAYETQQYYDAYPFRTNSHYSHEKFIQSGGSEISPTYKSPQSSSSSNYDNQRHFMKQLSNDNDLTGYLKSESENNEETAESNTSDTLEPEFESQHENQNNDNRNQNEDSLINQDLNSNSLSDSPSQTDSNTDSELQSLINQFGDSSPSLFKHQAELLSGLHPGLISSFHPGDYSALAAQYTHSASLPGLQGFTPAAPGSQLPAPPGYKHVGFITIPAGATGPNLPNLPLLRPMAPGMVPPGSSAQMLRPPVNAINYNRIPQVGLNQPPKLQQYEDQAKKQQEQSKQASELKPQRTLLSRLNPLNILRKLRQRRERRQAGDGSNDYGYVVPGYNSLSGLGGLGGLYSNMMSTNLAPVYASAATASIPSYSHFAGYGASYGPNLYGSQPMSYGYLPTAAYGQSSGDSKDSVQSTSQTQTVPMTYPMSMMPYYGSGYSSGYGSGYSSGYGSGYGSGFGSGYGSGYGGSYSPMSPMGAFSAPMPMTYQYPQSAQPTQQAVASSGDANSASGATGGTSEDGGNQQLNNMNVGGINLNDLLKDEEDDEPTGFRRFLSYLNPVNLFKKLRDRGERSANDDSNRRETRFRRDLSEQFMESNNDYSTDQVNPRIILLKRIKTKNNRIPKSNTNDTGFTLDYLDSADSGFIPFHENFGRSRRISFSNRRGRRINRPSNHVAESRQVGLMGSGNFEVIRGGTFRPEENSQFGKTDRPSYENEGAMLSAIEDDFYEPNSGVLGFQGYNGFSPLYNSLSESNKVTKFASYEPLQTQQQTQHSKRSDSAAAASPNIEHQALTTIELKAIS